MNVCVEILTNIKIISELYISTVNQILLLRILGNKIQRLLKSKNKK